MELVYLWVEDYKNIHKQGFNFSPRFECTFHDEYDVDGKLKENCQLEIIEKREDEYIKDFFGENINVTAIVGKNGSGKSAILEILDYERQKDNYERYWNDGEVEFINRNNYLFLYFDKGFKYTTSLSKKIKVKAFKLEKEEKVWSYEGDVNFYHFYREFELITLADKNYFDFINHDFIINSKYVFLKYDRDFYKELIVHLKYEFKDGKNIYANLGKNPNEQLLEQIIQMEEIGYKPINIIEGLFKNNRKEMETYFLEEDLKDLLRLPFEKKDDLWVTPYYSLNELTLSFNNSAYDFLRELNVIGYNYISNTNLNTHYEHYSLGEKKLLAILTNFIFTIKSNKGEKIFIFDEPDNYLHPQWQKKLFNYFITIIRKEKIKNPIHIILTSHSPFLLSDIPKQNIIFLDKDEKGNCKVVNGLKEKKQTFGANIHTLLSDSFFMKDGLMGEFAKGKINEIKKFYEKAKIEKKTDENVEFYKEHKEKFWQIQKIIGEPFLQTVIKNYLDELELLFSDDNTLIEKELADIEKRKSYLKSLKNA